MPKGCVLVVTDDRDGTSFVLFDCETRTIYNDIIERRRLHELYALHPVRLTVTDDRDFHPPDQGSRIVVARLSGPGPTNAVHDERRALQVAERVLGRTVRPHGFDILGATTRRLQLPGEEWASWVVA